MRKLTCRDLGGPCDAELTGESFEEIGRKSREHVIEQMRKSDAEHLAAANKMKDATSEQQQALMAAFRKKFDEAPEI